MLRPEEAKAALKKIEIEDPYTAIQEALAGCSERAGTIGAEMVDFAARPYVWQAKWYDGKGPYKAMERLYEAIDGLTETERGEVFSCVFSGMAEYVERAWRLLHGAPYAMGFDRKPFRAPQAPAFSRLRRLTWLCGVIRMLPRYTGDIFWWAAWCGHVLAQSPEYDGLEALLGTALDEENGNGAIREILQACAEGRHETGISGDHVIRAFLLCSNPACWEYVEQMLLNARREEGLRQSILDAADESHPEVFPRILRIILDNGLLRFSSTVCAIDSWFGFLYDTFGTQGLTPAIEKVLLFLEDEDARREAFEKGDAETLYLALWAGAFRDIEPVLEEARTVLKSDADPARRVAAVMLAVNSMRGNPLLLEAMHDDDWRVAYAAAQFINFNPLLPLDEREQAVTAIEQLLAKPVPRPKASEPILWPWLKFTYDRDLIVRQLAAAAGREFPKRMLPYLHEMESNGRIFAMNRLGECLDDAEVRRTLLAFLSDRSSNVRRAVVDLITRTGVYPSEAPLIEGMLTSKASDLRKAVLELLLAQPDDAAQASADRLLAMKNAQQREAGAEMLRQLVQQKRAASSAKTLARKKVKSKEDVPDAERRHFEAIVEAPRQYSLEDGLGLIAPGTLTPLPEPRNLGVTFDFSNAAANLEALHSFIHENKEKRIQYRDRFEGEKETFLGNTDFWLPGPGGFGPSGNFEAVLPERDMWESWYAGRDPKMRDADGLEWFRAALLLRGMGHTPHGLPDWIYVLREKVCTGFVNRLEMRYGKTLRTMCHWFLHLYPVANAPDRLLDAFETLLSRTFSGEFGELGEKELVELATSSYTPVWGFLEELRLFRHATPNSWTPEQSSRFSCLICAVAARMEEPLRAHARNQDQKNLFASFLDFALKPHLEELVEAYACGLLNDSHMLLQLLNPAEKRPTFGGRLYFEHLHRLSGNKPSPLFAKCPKLEGLIETCRERIVSIELSRGDIGTAASWPACDLRSVKGAKHVVALLRALGEAAIVRHTAFRDSKSEVLSHLLRVAYPLKTDTPEQLAQWAAEAAIPDDRLIELALFAPQWARLVEQTLAMPGLETAVWWVHAHAKDNQWSVDPDVRGQWAEEVTERTPLSAQDLMDGAVDVNWFLRMLKSIGEDGWRRIYAAARFASGSAGHIRVQLYADAMMGRTEIPSLIERIKKKRYQDGVRALGLIPVARGKGRQKDLLTRYETMQEFLRTRKQFGAQRQESEQRAVEIGMENLARTAGYGDPVRLQWAMEQQSIADLAKGPVMAHADDVTVTLTINEGGRPLIAVEKAGKPLKSVPPKAKKNEDVKELTERVTTLRRQASRMRLSLEEAMCRGDRFTGKELRDLLRHPILTPILRNLVFTNDSKTGYLGEGGTLCGVDGKRSAIGDAEEARIAHPYDLWTSGNWSEWQRDCFLNERVQPFKQVFRELYPMTQTEKDDKIFSARYAGHQVNSLQAMALLRQRNWVNHVEEGIRHTFHQLEISAWLEFLEGFFTPLEVEGLTIDKIVFRKVADDTPLALTAIPAAVFSEVMRDIDLVVSVAHCGGADPEASASTLETRAALVRETCRLLRIENVRIEGRFAVINGKLADYSLHLGSANVQMLPGGALVIVPIHAQHRGRLFLPFEDDDPRTAEVISKTLLLARDNEIKDPTILQQIGAAQ